MDVKKLFLIFLRHDNAVSVYAILKRLSFLEGSSNEWNNINSEIWPERLDDIAERLALINYWSWVMGTSMSVWNNKDICMKRSIFLFI